MILVLIYSLNCCARGRAVAQLVEALRYKPERRGFESADPSGRAV
jgi:hypothetical protein